MSALCHHDKHKTSQLPVVSPSCDAYFLCWNVFINYAKVHEAWQKRGYNGGKFTDSDITISKSH